MNYANKCSLLNDFHGNLFGVKQYFNRCANICCNYGNSHVFSYEKKNKALGDIISHKIIKLEPIGSDFSEILSTSSSKYTSEQQ